MHDEYARQLNAATAAELSDQRQQRGVSYDALIAETGLSKSTLNRIFNAKKSIDLEELVALTSSLGVDPAVVIRNAQKRARGTAGKSQPD